MEEGGIGLEGIGTERDTNDPRCCTKDYERRIGRNSVNEKMRRTELGQIFQCRIRLCE